MFIDARELPENHLVEADVCIVGAGAAGISMAREFIGTSKRVVVLESGGFEFDKRTQSLYRGENIGLPTFDVAENRLRYFGGTTNHWAGHCRPLDPIDFERRDWIPHSGWPISRATLEPYYRRAQPICELGEFKYEELDFFVARTGLPALELDPSRLQSVVYNQSPPTRFGTVYRDEIRASTNTTVYLNANLLSLETTDSGGQIERGRVACIDGPQFVVRARAFVLATGGMENARLLLLSGLGNRHDLVGRYFTDHILLRPGVDISFSVPGINLGLYHGLHEIAGGRMFSVLAASVTRMRRERLSNFRIHLVPLGPKFDRPLGSVFSGLDRAALVGRAVEQGYGSIALHMVLEPVPNPDSRITLSEERDYFNQRRIAVDWRLQEADLGHAYRALELAALEFGRLGLGRGFGGIFADPGRWPGNLEAGKHHCGTTRMADDPRHGVVNADCRVHGIDNLYVAGSSVFPTIGYANPTLTLVALALRLSDHLMERLA